MLRNAVLSLQVGERRTRKRNLGRGSQMRNWRASLGDSVWTEVAEGISGWEVLAWMNLRDDKGVNREDHSRSRPIT